MGFVTFHTRAGAEAAKQDLQVIALSSQVTRGKAGGKKRRWTLVGGLKVDVRLIHTYTRTMTLARTNMPGSFLIRFHLALDSCLSSWHGLMLQPLSGSITSISYLHPQSFCRTIHLYTHSLSLSFFLSLVGIKCSIIPCLYLYTYSEAYCNNAAPCGIIYIYIRIMHTYICIYNVLCAFV